MATVYAPFINPCGIWSLVFSLMERYRKFLTQEESFQNQWRLHQYYARSPQLLEEQTTDRR